MLSQSAIGEKAGAVEFFSVPFAFLVFWKLELDKEAGVQNPGSAAKDAPQDDWAQMICRRVQSRVHGQSK